MQRVTKCLVTVLITLAMVITVTQPIVSMEKTDENSNELLDSYPLEDQMPNVWSPKKESQENYIGAATTSFKHAGKLSKIVVATTDITELASLLENYQYNGWLGTETTGSRGIAFPILEVPAAALAAMEKLPGVLGIYDYKEPVNNVKTETNLQVLKGFDTYDTMSQDENVNAGSLYHGAEDAWLNGYTGDGVNVATITAGCDFGHYELTGRQAMVDDDFIYTVTNGAVVATTDVVVDNKTRLPIPDYYIVDNEGATVSLNSNIMTSGYTLFANGTLLFNPPIPAASEVTATYTYWSPYLNYPIAFDPTSMVDYLSEGPQDGYVTPGDSWYANTSSTDLHIYHTLVVDGANDFWEELNPHETANDTYDFALTSELRSNDPPEDINSKELDLTSLFVTSDDKNWYLGFDVYPEVEGEWKRSYDVKYGVYIDTVANSGADNDPLGNYVNTTAANQPEFAFYIHHTSVNWGERGSSVNWGVNSDGKWSKNRTNANNSDTKIWSKNNTVDNATFFVWDDGAGDWGSYILTENQPYNETVGIGPAAGSVIIEDKGKKYLLHDGDTFEILGNSKVPYYVLFNQSGFTNVNLKMVKGQQEYKDEFIELAIPKTMLEGVDNMSLMMFTVGDNKSHAQDTVPPDINVQYIAPEWSFTTTTLSNFTFIEAPPLYVVDGITNLNESFHIGFHPDQNLIKKHFGRPVTVLLAAQNDKDVFDTVYIDLDNDKSFSDELPLQALSAHNDTMGFVPSNGTVLNDDGTISHNSVVYQLYNKNTGEVLIEDADGRETEFRLEHRNILDAPLIQWNSSAGTKYLNKTDNYTIEILSGIITLNEPLETGDDLFVLNYTYEAEAYERFAYIKYNNLDREMELRSWIAGKDIDADGGAGDKKPYPDISGGMVYFIGNGETPIPYSDIITDRSGTIEDNRIPGNGELVAFFGEFDLDSVQGTEVATGISGVGAGIDGNNIRLIRGTAPNSKLIAARGGNPFEAWYFAVEGYDGDIGTGDDAQIIAVTTSYPVDESGWDVYSKAASYIGEYYGQGKTCFVAGVGDAGFGYGTAGSPAASKAVITTGVGTQFDYRNYNPGAPTLLNRVYADSGPSPMHGDVLPSSARGPNMLGNPEPDVITAGAFLFGSTPLNSDQDALTPSELDWYGGQWAWDLWSGSALSSASAAGMLALIYDAYKQANGVFPNIETARSLLRSGADNMNYDILTQGAGYINADRSTQLAANLDGLYLDQTYWVPGEYRGVKYDGFVRLMHPGDEDTQSFSIENKNPANDATIEIDDLVYSKFGSYEIPINITKTYDDKEIPAVVNIEPYIAIGTELLKVTITSERKAEMGDYMGELFDWTDVDEDGKLEFPAEQNRMVYCIGTNNLELRYRDPLGRVHDGLAVQVKEFGGGGTPLNEWVIHMDFYNKTDWDWLTFDGAVPTTVAAGGDATFDAKVTIPNDASLGSYEGAVYIKEKEPVETIATGVGEMRLNITFNPALWFPNPQGYTEGKVNDVDVTATNRNIVPKSTIISWNGTALYEGVDYDLSGVNGAVRFSTKYGQFTLPANSYLNMSYLTVAAVDGFETETATWFGETSIPNFVSGDGKIVIEKDGVPWDETEDINNETVLNAAGGELVAALANRNIVRETIELSKNGAFWDQDGGAQSEVFPPGSIINTTILAHGNIVPGSTNVYVNGTPMSQTGEVTVLNKEEVQGLNSTSTTVTLEGPIAIDGTWAGKLAINSDDTPDFKIIYYLIYEDGMTNDDLLTDGKDPEGFDMHVDGTHGKFRLNHDPTGHTYYATYVYYDKTIKAGTLAHGNVISESYTVYVNGQSMQVSDYSLNLKTGELVMTNTLGPDEVIEIAYKYNIYALDTRTGNITFADAFMGWETVQIDYEFFTYTLDLASGILAFADPLIIGDIITANYTYARYIYDMANGIVRFANPLKPLEEVTCEYWHYSAMVPVFINIGADTPNFTIGGGAQETGLYNYNEITGGYGSSGSGDWRYFYLDIMEQGIYNNPTDNQRLFIDVEWENDLTDVDVQVYGNRDVLPEIVGNALPSDSYGPHSVSHVGGSDETADFFTTTGGAEEIVSPKISGGLNVIALHTVGMNGSAQYTEIFEGRVGTMYIEPTEVEVVSNKLNGEQEIRMYSNMEWEGVGGIAAGPSAPESYENLTVGQDDPDWSNYDSFEQQLASGTTVYSRTIKDCLIFHVHIWGQTDFGYKDVRDLDLGVFLDGSGEEVEDPDGIVQTDEFVAYGADFDADEEVKLIAPPDGTYLIVVYGFDIAVDPAHFDMDITIVQGAGFDLDGTGKNSLPADQKGFFSSNQTENPFNITTLTLKWDLPGSTTGSLQGALYAGPGNGPMAMLIPIELVIDTNPPVIKSATFPPVGSVTSNNRPLISGSIEDSEREEIDVNTVKLFLDGEDITSIARVNVEFVDDTAASGYPQGGVQYTPNAPLSEGGHLVELRAGDFAGNMAIKTWSFTVDTKKPVLSLDTLSSHTYTNQDSVLIQGKADADSDVSVMIGAVAAEVKRNAVGGFTAEVDLIDGDNILMVKTTDTAGNENLQVFTLTRDTEGPTFDRLICLDGTLTNQPNTVISGSVSEGGTMSVNGDPASVNSDGTFDDHIELIEGENVFALEFTDMAGNVEYDWLNVTLDTQVPVINIADFEPTTYEGSVNITGSTEAGAYVSVNGKLVQVDETRQTTGTFSKLVTLSPGPNTLVIEARDSAGNSDTVYLTVTYDKGGDRTNYAAIGLMIVLLIVGLILGILLARIILGPGEPKDEDEASMAESEMDTVEELPEETIADTIVEPEDNMDGEYESDEDEPSDAGEAEEFADEDAEIPEGAEPIPDEEGMPEELPEDEYVEPELVDAEEPEVEAEETPDQIADELVADEMESEEIADELVAGEIEAPIEDPKILKLKQAYEEGKISKELYEKNLKRLQDQ